MNYAFARWSIPVFLVLVMASTFVNGVQPTAVVAHVSVESTRYFSGQVIRIRVSGTNTGNVSRTLNSTTSCLFDIAIIEDATGKEVYRYSNATVCAQVLTSITLAPNQTQTYETSWTHVGNTGLYFVHAWFVGIIAENGAAFWVEQYTVVTQTIVQTITSATTVNTTVTQTVPVYQPPDPSFYYAETIIVILASVVSLMIGYYFRRRKGTATMQ